MPDAPQPPSKGLVIASWVGQVIVAGMFVVATLPKLTGAEESIDLFTKLGAEPAGRYATGVFELVAAVLLLVPRTIPFGAVLAMGLMIGALGAHATKLGFSFEDGSGPMGVLAGVLLLISTAIAFIRRQRLLALLGK